LISQKFEWCAAKPPLPRKTHCAFRSKIVLLHPLLFPLPSSSSALRCGVTFVPDASWCPFNALNKSIRFGPGLVLPLEFFSSKKATFLSVDPLSLTFSAVIFQSFLHFFQNGIPLFLFRFLHSFLRQVPSFFQSMHPPFAASPYQEQGSLQASSLLVQLFCSCAPFFFGNPFLPLTSPVLSRVPCFHVPPNQTLSSMY